MCRWQEETSSKKAPSAAWRKGLGSQSARGPFKRNNNSGQSEGGETDSDTQTEKDGNGGEMDRREETRSSPTYTSQIRGRDEIRADLYDKENP